MSDTIIYKILTGDQWAQFQADGRFTGAPIDITDGYIHMSTAAQVRETAAKHFAGQADLVLIAVDADSLGEKLKWEVSRGGDLFPHLYEPLDVAKAESVSSLPLGPDGQHDFPAGTCTSSG